MKVSPASAGLDERQLERITEHFQTRYIDAGRIAGCQVAVARHGQVGYFRSFGVRDLERSAPVEEDTIWRIYSMTKLITGVALMSLYETLFEPLGMNDTSFTVPDGKVGRFAACYRRDASRKLVLTDDPQRIGYRKEPSFLSGGGGLVSTTADYLRFCQMLLGGGELGGVRILGRKTIELMTSNHLPGDGDLKSVALPGGYGEVGFAGIGFGLTVAVAQAPTATQVIGSRGEYMWGGAASTIFWVDPAEDLTVVFMTQLLPSGTFNFRGQLKTLVYPAIVD
jgi:CubicO group peptidase (beta-lactamase class C family)